MAGLGCIIVFLLLIHEHGHGFTLHRDETENEATQDIYHPHTLGSSQIDRQTLDIDWGMRAEKELEIQLATKAREYSAQNVVVMIGDGMGVSTHTAARFFSAQYVTGSRVEDGRLNWEGFPYTGMTKVYNADQATPDSGGTATAFLCGEKTRAYTIGVSQQVPLGDCAAQSGQELRSVLHHAVDAGKAIGIVTTARVTHATPAAGYAHSAERDWEFQAPDPCPDIASQFIDLPENQLMKVMLGGGRRGFFPVSESDNEYGSNGRRTDGRNLVQEWLDQKAAQGLAPNQYSYVENLDSFNAVDPETTEYLLGLFEPSHMQYEVDRLLQTGPWQEPSLPDMVDKAIAILSRNPQGYVLLVEGGRVDHAHHDNNAYRALSEAVVLSDAVQRVMDNSNPNDTLVVLTADHSHTFSIAGNPALDNDILGLEVGTDGEMSPAADLKPYTTLGYGNGPGFMYHRGGPIISEPRMDLSSNNDTDDVDFLQDAGIPQFSGTHAGEDISIFANGPMAHLFVGLHEQNYIAHAIAYAACIGPNQSLCDVRTKADDKS